jgi:NhaA family Na+:H+ antiporter
MGNEDHLARHAGLTLVPVPRSTPSRIATRVSGLVLDYLVALPVGCVAALWWANTLPDSYYRLTYATTFAVNDIGLVFFFALITKEVAEATLPGGALHPWRRASLPVVAAVGSVVVSTIGYVAFLRYVGEPMLEEGWVAACAVDIPGTYIIARLIFGRHPAVPFLLLLAIAADVIGLICLAVWYPIGDVHVVIAVALMAVAVGAAATLRRRGVHSFWWYVLGPGTLSWWALFLGGVHPALALVPIVPFLPHGRRDQGLFVEPTPAAHDTLTLFERWWRLPVEGVLLAFGLVNAGVPLHGADDGMWALPLASLARPIGILAATGLALAVGLHLPERVGWRELLVIGCIASISLVFALFFATAVMPFGPLLSQMKTGALVTIAGGGLAFALARWLRVGRFAHER